MNKGLMIICPVVCLAFAVAAACGGPAIAPENKGGADSGNGSMYILVENTSISLPIKPLRPDSVELIYPIGEIWEMTGDSNRDRLVDFIRVKLGEILEGKGQ